MAGAEWERFTEDLLCHLKEDSLQGETWRRVPSWKMTSSTHLWGRLEEQGVCLFFALRRESLGRKEGKEGGPPCQSAEEREQAGAGRTR